MSIEHDPYYIGSSDFVPLSGTPIPSVFRRETAFVPDPDGVDPLTDHYDIQLENMLLIQAIMRNTLDKRPDIEGWRVPMPCPIDDVRNEEQYTFDITPASITAVGRMIASRIADMREYSEVAGELAHASVVYLSGRVTEGVNPRQSVIYESEKGWCGR